MLYGVGLFFPVLYCSETFIIKQDGLYYYISIAKFAGKWAFVNVHLDIEHWLVGEPSTN